MVFFNGLLTAIAVLFIVVDTAFGDAASIGPNGINAVGLGLTGAGIGIGQAELFRPGDPDLDTIGTWFNSTVNPKQVFYHSGASFTATANSATQMQTPHSEYVAGVMISTAPVATGVAAPSGMLAGADLYSIGGVNQTNITTIYNDVAENLQFLAAPDPTHPERGTQKIWAINQSLNMAASDPLNGNSLPTQFIDWSARTHDVLYVITGVEEGSFGPVPVDNFNGITVAMSSKPFGGNQWNQVSAANTFLENPTMDRTFIDIVAPGEGLSLTNRDSVVDPPNTMRRGTSFAAPHVTGTVALLQEFAAKQIMNVGSPRWKGSPGAGQNAPAQRHEVMKAVLMNSADKIKDDGTFMIPGDANPAPPGTFLGMEKTISKVRDVSAPPVTWFDSAAYDDDVNIGSGFIPLDNEMGTGQLNAKRALQQFKPGEYDANGAAVPNIGWDLGHTTGMNNNQKYVFAQQLTAGMFVSVTLVWDRRVDLDNDAGTLGAFNAGDTFTKSESPSFQPENDDQINDLDLHFLPQGAISTATEVAASISTVGTVEHIFFRIPTTGNYEFWVSQFDQESFTPTGQDYAVAWWYGTAPPIVAQGDYNGDQVVDAQDYNVWRGGLGTSVTPGTGADGNGNGVIDAADYVIWRKQLGAGSGVSLASVPEPSVLALLVIAGVIGICRRRSFPAR